MNYTLISLAVLFSAVVLPWVIWRFCGLRWVVPCAVVQISIGILLGPSLLGNFAPHLSDILLPPNIRTQVDGIATLAVLYFALLTGLHIDVENYRGKIGRFALIGIGSVAMPFALGGLAAAWIWQTIPAAMTQHGEAAFLFSIATALSVTALPVLGAILRDLLLLERPLGQWSLGLAAMNDAALWLLVSLLLTTYGSVAMASHYGSAISALCAAVYIGVMYGIVQPLLRRKFAAGEGAAPIDSLLVGVTAFTLISASITELLGFHYLFGAFIAGTVLPRRIRLQVVELIEHVMVLLLTPFFFISIGLKVNLNVDSHQFLTLFWILTGAAVIGKFIGTTLPSRFAGLSWRDSFALGSLMQAKGMMELAILTILLDAGLISQLIFSVLTLMALVTTALSMILTRLAIGRPAITLATARRSLLP
jgi:Kef-type K+ transport system membrane component KefB